MPYDNFYSKVTIIRDRVAAACAACGRNPSEVEILPVSKYHPAQAVLAAVQAGFTAFGENRVAELVEKKAACAAALGSGTAPPPPSAPDTNTASPATPATDKFPATPAPATGSNPAALRWELIGHLQSNKARLAVAHADRIQSVDSVKLLQKLSALCAELERPSLPVLLQINAGNDPAKFGADLSDAPELLDAALALPHIEVEGLMTIAPLDENLDVAAQCFTNLRQLRDALQTTHKVSLPVLSMGMTTDLEQAIYAGSTQLRIGTALFGEREY